MQMVKIFVPVKRKSDHCLRMVMLHAEIVLFPVYLYIHCTDLQFLTFLYVNLSTECREGLYM